MTMEEARHIYQTIPQKQRNRLHIEAGNLLEAGRLDPADDDTLIVRWVVTEYARRTA